MKIRSSHLALRFYIHDGWSRKILDPLVTRGKILHQESFGADYYIPEIGTELDLESLFKLATSVQTWDNKFLVGEEMKVYFVCEYRSPQWWVCDGILENGFHFGQHICSYPSFAPGDLYFTRKNRIEALKELFGIDEDHVRKNHELLTVTSQADIPTWWNAHQEMQEGLRTLYEKYNALVGNSNAKVEIEMESENV